MSKDENDHIKPEISALEQENQALHARIERLERALNQRQKTRKRMARTLTGIMFGRPLRDSVSQLVDELSLRQINKETIKDVVYSFLKRISRVGMIWFVVALGPIMLALLQTYYLKKQNEKLDTQNRRIEQQTFLQEAERRSSLIFLFDNVLDKMDEELRGKTRQEERILSPQLIGRIVALSIALKPYRFLEGDTITPSPTSPERGQLLMGLVISKLNKTTYDQIFAAADFSYATLRNINLNDAYMRYARLQHAVLEDVSLVGADLSYSDLTGAQMYRVSAYLKSGRARGACFDFARFTEARIESCDFSGSSFKSGSFARAHIRQTYLEDALFTNTEFSISGMDSVWFRGAQFNESVFISHPSADKAPANPALVITKALFDSSSFESLRQWYHTSAPTLEKNKPLYRIRRDTPYIDEKGVPFVILDSLILYPVR
jgi:uncharacterized protein YjbI with pentapeptide repeats